MAGLGNAVGAAIGAMVSLALAIATADAAATTTVVDVPTRPGVTQRFLYVRPDAPIATIVLLPGGEGVLDIRDDGTMPTSTATCNPIVRNRAAFAARGYALALIDQSSDLQLYEFTDVREVVSYVRNRDNIPTWIIGGDASTAAALNFGIDLPLTEPMGAAFYSPAKLSASNIARAAQLVRPALVVFHEPDPDAYPAPLYASVTSVPAKQFVGLSGGNDLGCGYHLFNGIDGQFVAAVAAFMDTYTGTLVQVAHNYQGLWWVPAGAESGWGLNVAHQGDAIFATWFTYDTNGKEWWLSMTANKSASNPDTYTGQLIETRGPAFSAAPFDPTKVTRNTVGSGTLAFTDANNGTFAYSVTTTSAVLAQAVTQQTKAITRQVFSTLPSCSFVAQANPAATTNYTDLWWASPGASESGWGVNFTHQGASIFATWFTYDGDGSPLWLSATLQKGAGEVFSGDLIQTAGPAFSAVPFDPTKVTRTMVGTATLNFSDGNTGNFAYTAKNVTQQKAITRQLFSPPAGTVCH